MPASLYRLAGRHHPVEQPAADVESAPVIEVVEQVATSQFEQTIEASTPQLPAEQVVDPTNAVDEDPAVPEPAAPTYPVWDSSWTKTKLLGIATDLGLAVTIDSTKSEIVAALTAATSS